LQKKQTILGRASDTLQVGGDRIGIESSEDLAFVWEENDKIFGFVSAHDLGFRAYISELIAGPERRESGIGKTLIQEVEKTLIKKGDKVLIADV
jgi:predicted N-acetyltransferase YhbS